MPRLFLRKSRSTGNWDSVNDETPEDLNFPADVLADVLDMGNEVSVWELDPESPEMDYLVAALHRPTDENLSDATFRVLSAWRLDKLGLKLKNAKGVSLDSKLNGVHRVIEVNTVSDAIRLAKAFKERPPCILSRAEVMRKFAASLQAKRIGTDKVAHQLWRRLIEEGYMQIVAQPTSSSDADAANVAAATAAAPTAAAATAAKHADPIQSAPKTES
jgi:hypothetical protein